MTPEVLMYRQQRVKGKAIVSLRCLALLVVKEGPKFLHAVAIDNQVKVLAIPKDERRYMRPILRKGKPYDAARAVRRFKAAGRTLGITKGAAIALRSVDQRRD